MKHKEMDWKAWLALIIIVIIIIHTGNCFKKLFIICSVNTTSEKKTGIFKILTTFFIFSKMICDFF